VQARRAGAGLGLQLPPQCPPAAPSVLCRVCNTAEKHTTQQRADEENMQQEACSGERRVAQAVGGGC
jgi:hypothetical protein